jgi:hypothetical protein
VTKEFKDGVFGVATAKAIIGTFIETLSRVGVNRPNELVGDIFKNAQKNFSDPNIKHTTTQAPVKSARKGIDINVGTQKIESTMGNVKPLIMEQPTVTKMGTFNDDKLLQTACTSWSRMSQDTKTKYKSWSAKQIGNYSYNPEVACNSKTSDSISSDNDREMLKAIINLDFM